MENKNGESPMERLTESFKLFMNLEFSVKSRSVNAYLRKITGLYKGEKEKLASIPNAFAIKQDQLIKDSLEKAGRAMKEYSKDCNASNEKKTDRWLFLQARSKIRKANETYVKLLQKLHEKTIAGSEKVISDFYDEALNIFQKYSGVKTCTSV